MTGIDRTNLTRRNLLKAGSALAAVPLIGFAAPVTLAQGQTKSPTKVLDFMTNADVAKAEQEGQLVFYCHENEAGTAGIMQGFSKDFPKIKTSYVRAQTGALYNKILSERSAGRFDVDVIQFSDLAPAVDFQKKGGYEHYVSPESHAYKADNLSTPVGSFFWTGVDPAGIAYNTDKVSAADAPKSWHDINQSEIQGPHQRQDFGLGLAVRAVVLPARTLRRQVLEGIRQAAAACFRQPRAIVRPPGQGRRRHHRDRRISGLHPVQEQRRQGRIRRAAGWTGGNTADRRRGQQGAASGSEQAVRRLGDVEARPGLVSDQSEPLLRLGAHRRAADADRREALRLQAASTRRIGTNTPRPATSFPRNGTA